MLKGHARLLYNRLVVMYITIAVVSGSAMLVSNRFVSEYSSERLAAGAGYIAAAFACWVLLASGFSRRRLSRVEAYLNGESGGAQQAELLPIWRQLVGFPVHLFWFFLLFGLLMAQGSQLLALAFEEGPRRWLYYGKSTLFNATSMVGLAFVHYGLSRSILRRSMPVLGEADARELRFVSLLRPLTLAFICAITFPLLRIMWHAAENESKGSAVSPATLASIALIGGLIVFVAFAILSFSFIYELRDMIGKLRLAAASHTDGSGSAGEAIPLVSRYEAGQLAVVYNELQVRKRNEYARLLHERELAGNVQRHIMHKGEAKLGNWRVRGEARENGEIGGHFYDIVHCGGGKLAFVAGCVSGGGMPSALALSAFIGMFRSEAGIGDAAGLADRLNARLGHMFRGTHTIDVLLGVADFHRDHIDIVRAGMGLQAPAFGERLEGQYRSSTVPVGLNNPLLLTLAEARAGAVIWVSRVPAEGGKGYGEA
ncbi:PP2C family protein-serine/threonine phosphatase [Paenibacillus ginsengarvi]|uniref:PPM-type phosphatase domain-containing protein n=1 Tax=Paenibacillus ginsengarvi TaxID=400777 RepID=A0A3B0C3A4_9BACL|nr:SpoIIE family protein phosphatase [Paenibacillus ginsengarvi]RKN78914.1 hypothetical protein D7M11_22875 [Paenibacillus ginsengarvi]